MNESRAIAAYLANAYDSSNDNSMYPKTPTVRAKVDQMMYFDMGQLYKAFGDCFVSTSINVFALSKVILQKTKPKLIIDNNTIMKIYILVSGCNARKGRY